MTPIVVETIYQDHQNVIRGTGVELLLIGFAGERCVCVKADGTLVLFDVSDLRIARPNGSFPVGYQFSRAASG